MIKGVCFDLDGTLGRFTGDFEAFAALLRDQLVLQMCDMNRFQGLLGAEFRHDGPLTVADALGRVLGRLEQRPPPDLHQLAADAVAAYAEEFRPLPGAEALLARLDAAGVKLALLSNGPVDMQRAALGALGVERRFRVVLISGDRDVAARKPAARIFSLACAGLELSPEELLMVGDNLEADIKGARDFGLQPVLVAGHAGEGAADAARAAEVPVVDGLPELDDLLRARHGL